MVDETQDVVETTEEEHTEVVEATDCAYFNNTIPYAIAFAIYQKVASINLFGVCTTSESKPKNEMHL